LFRSPNLALDLGSVGVVEVLAVLAGPALVLVEFRHQTSRLDLTSG
jgi:hypothetical protein